MDACQDGRARSPGLRAHEWLYLALGSVALATAAVLVGVEPFPALGPLALLCVLSALSVRFNVDADEGGKIAASAVGMVMAATLFAFRGSSPVLGPMIVGMAAAFFRMPRTRHHWMTLSGNLAVYGFPALAAGALLARIAITEPVNTLALCAVTVPLVCVYGMVNGGLTMWCVSVASQQRMSALLREVAPHLIGMYVPFLFGAVIGELSLRFGLIVFPLAAVSFVMVQVVFSSYRKLVESEHAALEGLVAAVEQKDPYTAGRSMRVKKFAHYMGHRLGWRGKDLARLEQHALMHDIGKLAVPNHVLRKPGRLTADERDLMRRHEGAGAAILARVPFLVTSADIANGFGHRDGFDKTPRAAHIVHAADAFDAMTSTRAYRRAHTQADALDEMHAKAGSDFHPSCVDALERELGSRHETYGQGFEEELAIYDVAPPEAPLGSTLEREAASDTRRPQPPPAPPRPKRPRLAVPRETSALIALLEISFVASLCAALMSSTINWDLIALSTLVAAGEVAQLRPLGRSPRPLSYIVMLVVLHAAAPSGAVIAIGIGELIAAGVRDKTPGSRRSAWFAARLLPTAALIGGYAGLSHLLGDATVGATLTALAGAAAAGIVVQELIDTRGRPAFDANNRLADLAIVACGPLVALGVSGTSGEAGLGLGAFVVLVVPLALLTQGYQRTQRAHENLFAWMRAVSLAPEHAGLVVPGRAERVAYLARALGRRTGLDLATTDQLEAAAWMERVGECCLDETYVTGEPNRLDEIVDASATILKSSALFYPAGQILWASLSEPEIATATPIDRAGQILRVAIAFEDATNGELVLGRIPDTIAMLRTSALHPVDVELCDALQQIIAPGSMRSRWEPVRTHALLSCGCVLAVDEWSFAGDDAECAQHGVRAVEELALERARGLVANAEALEHAVYAMLASAGREGIGLLRELVVRLAATEIDATSVAPVVRSGYHAGRCYEGQVAAWLREAGVRADVTLHVLQDAGTPAYHADVALTYGGYTKAELDLVSARAA
jgi:hypothetical protein